MDQLDPQVLALAKAIRYVESKDNFTARSKDGSFGAYQFIKPTWDATAKKYGVTAAWEQATPQEQNKVAYLQLKEWKDKGYNIGQVASMWNAGAGRPDAYKTGLSGVNKDGVRYDTAGYAKKVATLYQQYKQGVVNPSIATNPQPQIILEQPKTLAGKILGKTNNTVGQFSEGVAMGLLNTVQNIGQLGLKGVKAITGKDFGVNETFFNDPGALTPKTTGQKIGKTVENIAEFFVPAGNIAKGQRAIDIALQGKGALKTIARIGGKATLDGVGAAGVTYAQTQDTKKATTAGLIGGGLKAGFSTVGELANKAKLPERLYSTIFKNSYRDMLDELKTVGTKNLQRTNPERFKELVDSGIIKTGIGGKPIVNETLAKQALDRGLRGNLKTMSNITVNNLYENEAAAREIAKTFKGKINVPESKKLYNLLVEISDDYQSVGGNFADEASSLAAAVKSGKIDANTGLTLKRFLDGMRIRSSFSPGQKLSQSQSNFKYFANSVRGELYKIPGFKSVMQDYAFNIEALEALAKEAARRGNRQLIGFIDAALVGGGAAGGNVVAGATLGAMRRLAQSPRAITGAGQGFKNLSNSSIKGIVSRSLAGRIFPDQSQ